MNTNPRNRRAAFAAYFGNSPFRSSPPGSPLLMIGLAVPLLAVMLLACFAVVCAAPADGLLCAATVPIWTAKTRAWRSSAQKALATMADLTLKANWEGGEGWTPDVRSAFVGAERDFDSAAHRVSLADGEPFGPAIDEGLSPTERYQARQAWWDQAKPNEERTYIPAGTPAPGDAYPPASGGPFRTLGEQLGAVIRADSPGQAADPRLFEVRAPSGMNEGIGAEGGFLVQSAFSDRLLNRGFQKSKLADRCSNFPLGDTNRSNTLELPYCEETSRATGSRWGGIRLYWGSEGGERTGSKPKLGKFTLTLNKLTGLVYLTDEVIEDTSVLAAFVTRAFESEFGFVLDDAIIRGPGAGQPLGILNAPCLVTVSKEAGQAADTIVTENVIKMFARLLPDSFDNAVWYVNQACWTQLLQLTIKIKNVAGSENVGGSAVPLIQTANLSGAPTLSMLGKPIVPLDQCSALGDVGDIILGDFGRYLLVKRNFQVASSMHVRFLFDEQVLRFTLRLDGRPDLPAAVTPYKGADDLGPFIALQAR